MKYRREDRLKLRATAAVSPANALSRENDATGPVFFWRESDEPYGFLCQWYQSRFKDADVHNSYVFNCAEQYMMYRKALVLATPDDQEDNKLLKPGKHSKAISGSSKVGRLGLTAEQLPAAILATQKPGEQKALARSVRFTDKQLKIWETVKFDVVTHGSYLKYSQNVELKARLLATGDRELVEASPTDRVWGIGFAAKVAMNVPRDAWGSNLLGKALMSVRERLRVEEEDDADEDPDGN